MPGQRAGIQRVDDDTGTLLADFHNTSLRDLDGTLPSGCGINVRQAQWLVREGVAEWVTEPRAGSRRWEWRLRDASSAQEAGNRSPDVV